MRPVRYMYTIRYVLQKPVYGLMETESDESIRIEFKISPSGILDGTVCRP